MMKRILFLASLLIGLALAFAPLEAPRVIAQTFSGQPSPGYVQIGQGAAQPKWLAISGCAITSGGTFSCPFTAITSAAATDTGTFVAESGNFTVQTSNCNNTFLFSSTSQATVTAAAGSTFPANCRFWIKNTGNYTGSGSARGLLLSGISGVSFPNQGYALYPNQTTEFSNIGTSSAWVETGYSYRQLWKPSATATFFVDCSAGSNTASDGLGTTSGANATLAQGYIRLSNFVDYSGGAAQAILSSTGSCPTGDTLHVAGPLRGSSGNAAFVWNGNSTTTVNGSAGSPCAAVFDKAVIEIIGIDCENSGSGGCFSVSTGATIFFITTKSICNPGTGQGYQATDGGSKIEFVNVMFDFGSGVGGTSPVDMFNISNGAQLISDSGGTINVLGNLSFSSATAVSNAQALIDLSSVTFNLNSHTVTGLRYICQRFAGILGTSGAPNTFFPGNSNGTTGSDCFTP